MGQRASPHLDWETCPNTDIYVDVVSIVNIYISFYRVNFRLFISCTQFQFGSMMHLFSLSLWLDKGQYLLGEVPDKAFSAVNHSSFLDILRLLGLN